MKNLMFTLSLTLLANAALATENLTVNTVEVQNFESSSLKGMNVAGSGSGTVTPDPTDPPKYDLATAGQVVTVAKDIVALGEAIYTLVQKGKPSNTTDFSALAIVPKDPISKEALDPFELETCSFPVEKKFTTSIKRGSSEVVKFEYMVIYVYGCSYNGSGAFIQAAMVQPVSVKTGYGWDFNATMKLSGIMNHGTKADPIAGAMLTIKYQMNSWGNAFERNDTIHITGKGEFKSYTR